jgi:sulfatase modifying factor 1
MAKVFLSYRRQDTPGISGRIFDRLRGHFGDGFVFMDVDSIPPGVDFRKYIAAAVQQCDVVVAVIGRNWAGNEGTSRRLDDPRDFVRIELEAALKRDLPVIPILIDRAPMPAPQELPPSLASLAFRNALVVDQGQDFHPHVDRLIKGIERLKAKSQSKSPGAAPHANEEPSVGKKSPTPRLPKSPGSAANTRTPDPEKGRARVSVAATDAPEQTEILEEAVNADQFRPTRWRWYILGGSLLSMVGLAASGQIAGFDPSRLFTGSYEGLKGTMPRPQITNSLGMRLVQIDPGRFQMGSTNEQIDRLISLAPQIRRERFDDEQPQHAVEIKGRFFMAANEVTVGEFRRFVDATSYQTEAEKDRSGSYAWIEEKKSWELDSAKNWRNPGFRQDDSHPVVCTSYNDATAFCTWLTKQEEAEGRIYRLPTEAEWEFTCRAGTDALFLLSDDPEELYRIANVADASVKQKDPNFLCIRANDGFLYTAPVGSFASNRWGIYDMIGNVREWSADGYDAKYYWSSPAADPPGAAEVSGRVIRGGSWMGDPLVSRPAFRYNVLPGYRATNLGIRVLAVEK